MWVYDRIPGAPGRTAEIWPAESALRRDGAGITLVMTLHPKCACSVASIAELARVEASAQGGLRAYVLAVIPEGASGEGWERASLLARAGEIPGVKVITDRDGVEAKRFGAETSGSTSLYAADGRLLFCGGITGSRGHEGDNVGEDAIIRAVQGQQPAVRQSPVFGCALFAEANRDDRRTPQLLARNGGAK
jgi:hypothetical protein